MHIYAPGTHIGPYEIVSPPHAGGMGVVFFCIDHDANDRPVALKTFKPEYLPDRAARDRFLREGTAWVDLGNHPHIVRCFKVEYMDPTAFLVLELIVKDPRHEDASLRSWMGTPLPLEQALTFAIQVVRGMRHAVQKLPGFVHRDLKPENLLIGTDKLPGTNINRLRVTDFGLVKVVGEAISLPADSEQAISRTQLTHGTVGTPVYMAPEQWLGESVSIFTDVYALGCILYEMLTGQRAADGKTLNQLQQVHVSGKLRPLPVTLPVVVRNLLQSCLARQPEERYEDWQAVEAALEDAYTTITNHPLPSSGAPDQIDQAERAQTGWSYDVIGLSYMGMGQAQVAIDYFKRVAAIAEQEDTLDLQGTALIHLGQAYAALGNPQRGIEYYNDALATFRRIGDRFDEAAVLGSLGLEYASIGDAQQAIKFHEQALAINRAIDNREGEATDLGNLGLAYANLGDYRRAIGFYQQSLAIDRELGNRRGEGNALGNLGSAYAALDDSRLAINLFEQQLVITREIGDRRGEGNALGSLGSTYLSLGETQQAIDFSEQRLEIAREINDRRGEGATLSNLGLVYMALGNIQQAIRCYERALVILREIGDRRSEALASWNLGSAYEEIGDLPRAIDAFEICVDFERTTGHPDAQQDAAKVARLRERLQGKAPPPDHNNLAQIAFDSFQHTASLQDMQTAVAQYPLLTSPDFIAVIVQAIRQQVSPEQMPYFEQRLNWLRQVTGRE